MPPLKAVTDGGAELRLAYGRFPSGVTAVCALLGGAPIGFTASAFVAVSLRPPLVSICVMSPSWTWRRLCELPRIGVTVLGEGHEATARSLALKSPDRFLEVRWSASDSGAVFIDGAAAQLEFSIEDQFPAGDHELVLLRIRRLSVDPTIDPLVFHGSQFRKLEASQ